MVLSEKKIFPDIKYATPEGIVACGANLKPEVLLSAYREGVFPWYNEGEPILWWSPNPRGIIPIDGLHVSRSLKKMLKKNIFKVTFNLDFQAVISGCAHRPDGSKSGWITNDMINAYTRLHQLGYAKSVEVWRDNKIVGGIYGVSINGFFAAESMFYRESNASKVAIVLLIERLKKKGFILFDCQMVTNATKVMGALWIPREDYLRRLQAALKVDTSF